MKIKVVKQNQKRSSNCSFFIEQSATGYSLVELLIAFSILSLVIVTTIDSYLIARRKMDQTKSRTIALVRSVSLEELQNEASE